MNEHDRLSAWMEERGETISSLAQELGISYDGAYQALRVRKHISPELKWRFVLAFGADEALSIFDSAPEPA